MALKIYSDGGARGNPGPAAAAFVVEKDGKVIYKKAKYFGVTTNNTAEYRGAILALTWLSENFEKFPEEEATMVLDSELVAKQLSGVFKIKNENLRNLFFTVKNLESKIKKKIFYTNISRHKNRLADFLVNKTLDENL